ncbi:alpha/beta fold hydrolase [Pseudobacteroides cellulosolvens]|uniref:AB hydrolase-1 domain-containing protein n=1 Tax=Pseudobacteroides cellulosolvens ATCC 35603 = DSM 2933 TaxID=398512 RepID=A0A0L6JTW3_9FIRM|nr:alpha/beta hydrolase [Pseudobacteroides cellulosolvens]KNY29169.1 hypothetical protein Bccel_4443 [Pseudobacteroides cellulosolvens ATCC 35603 = DSM 2933]
MIKKIISLTLSTVLIFGITSAAAACNKPSVRDGNFSGKLNVGGYSMYIEVEGKRQHGLPTVVFENGNGDSHEIWDKVAPEIAKKTRVVTYDRIGIGQSDSPDRSKVNYTAAGEVQRLHTLLKKAGVNGPIVLVAHSIGGLYAREYKYLYPDQLKGIVFIDSAVEYQESNAFPELDNETILAMIAAGLSGGTGIPYELSANDLINTYKQIDTAQATDPLRNLPIEVLSGGNHGAPENFEVILAEGQAYIASLSNLSIHKTDPNNGHYLHQDNPSFVIDGINELLARLKSANHNR